MTTLLFRCDDEMWPSQIKSVIPDAQFVARGWVSIPEKANVDAAYETYVDGRVWGVLLETDMQFADSQTVPVQADDGRQMMASFVAPLMGGSTEDLLAVAQYWELPPSFIQALKACLQDNGIAVQQEEPRDDGMLDQGNS